MPDCQGTENSRLGSNGGDFEPARSGSRSRSASRTCRASARSRAGSCARPSSRSRRGGRARPSSPCAYCWRTLPKNWSLSLISSMYLILVPYFFWKRLERRALLVDVERPVREVQSARDLALRDRLLLPRPSAAAAGRLVRRRRRRGRPARTRSALPAAPRSSMRRRRRHRIPHQPLDLALQVFVARAVTPLGAGARLPSRCACARRTR